MSDPYEGMSNAESLRHLAKRYLRKPECIEMVNRCADVMDRLENPSDEILLSAALRIDHGLAVRQADWDTGASFLEPETDEQYIARVEHARQNIRKVLEEFLGVGYYGYETHDRYRKMVEANVKL